MNNISITPSEFAKNFVYIEGHPFSFDDCAYMVPIYDCPQPSVLIMAGRQVGKSQFMTNRPLSHCCTTPYFESLVVHPTQKQTEEFSHAKLKMALHHSPVVRKFFFDPKICKDQVTHVSFMGPGEGSSIKLRYCFLNANRVRGMSVNMIEIDEIQDILSENIPVIQETLTGRRAPVKYQIFAGTPKTYQHSIQKFWDESTQSEWVIRCKSCNYWNVPGIENVKEQGLSCKKCGKLIDPKAGEFISFNTGAPIAGFRVPQLIAPWIPWKFNASGYYDPLSIWNKFQTYDTGKFFNEVLGLPYEDASKPITLLEMIEACNPELSFMGVPRAPFNTAPLFAGIDWGHYGPGTTVLMIGGIFRGRLYVIFAKRYMGMDNEPKELVKDIVKYCRIFQCKLVNADFGGGWGPNHDMRDALPDRFITTDYALSGKTDRWRYNKKIFSYMVHRTGLITEVLTAIKRKKIVFPSWSQWKPFGQDILNIFVDYQEGRNEIRYDHHPDNPDDALHALLYLMVAAEMFYKTKLIN